MAYDATKKRQPGTPSMGQSTDPYAALLDPPAADHPGGPATQVQSTGPTPTGFVNFGDVYNANADAAKASANQLQTSAASKATGAQAELGQAQSAFTGAVQAGTPQGPSTADFQRASTRKTEDPLPAGVKTTVGEGLESESTKAGGGGTVDATAPANLGHGQVTAPYGATATTSPKMPGETDAQWQARIAAGQAKAQAGYKGPDTLSGSDTYDKLLNDTTSAQDEANALASGNAGIAGALPGGAQTASNAFDAALLGASNRGGFVGLGDKYGGLVNKLGAADTASQKQSDYAKQESANALTQYGLLANKEKETSAADAQATAAKQAATPAADTSGWGDSDQAAYDAAVAQAKQQSGTNGGYVQTNLADQNQTLGSSSDQGTHGKGWGFFGGADGGPGEQIGINEYRNADGSADTAGWWGGAAGPDVGDPSIPADVWYTLAALPPDERAKWWKHNHPGGS